MGSTESLPRLTGTFSSLTHRPNAFSRAYPEATGQSSGHEIENLVSALRLSIGLLGRRLRQAQSDGGLSMSEAFALALLDRDGPTTSGALAKREQLTQQSIGGTLLALEARGLVQRLPDPDDRRRAVLSLTPAGSGALRSGESSMRIMAEVLLTNFTPSELQELNRAAALIERLARAL